MMQRIRQRKTIQWKKNRDGFKKIRDIKGKFHAKMGKIKHINSKDLTDTEEIKKRQEE